MSSSFQPISDYALIGNGQTAALVGRNGSIDWCCWPRFDSPAVFCRLLDAKRGGYFHVEPCDTYEVSRGYDGTTNILKTTFATPQGRVTLTDFMPAPSDEDGKQAIPHRILRRIECIDGHVEMSIDLCPTFEYAQAETRFEVAPEGVLAFGNDEALGLVSSLALSPAGSVVHGRQTLSVGEEAWLVLTHGPARHAEALLQDTPERAAQEYERTLEYWKAWSGRCRYAGRYREEVLRSALALKLLFFQPTGGLVAAPTTSLPAIVGGTRNWDYRFTWLRDAGLVLDALQALGYHDESMQFIDWLEDLCLNCDDGLRVLYTVDGKPAPAERTLDHLAGHLESRPVRIGNAAVDQLQIDNYGHVVDAVILCYERMPRDVQPQLWAFLRTLVNRAKSRWKEPDQGPWEIRGPAKHYVYSKLYCWVGFDRAIRFAQQHQLPGEIDEWKAERDAVREAILSHGYSSSAGAFSQAFDDDTLDASSLTIPLTGLLPAGDERVINTMRQVERHLAPDGLVYRYRADDGLPESDATFLLCSYWLVMNLSLVGKQEEAIALFDRLAAHANDVGLLSEQVDTASGELRGNFPQGFAHLGLIRAALHLDSATEDRRAKT